MMEINRIITPTNTNIKIRTVTDQKRKVRRNTRTIKISTKTNIEKRYDCIPPSD